MNQKNIGIGLIIFGVLLSMFVYGAKVREDNYINAIIDAQAGSCYLEDGTCLHQDRDYTPYIIGFAMAGILVVVGLYLVFVDQSQQKFAQHQEKVSSALAEASKKASESEKFQAFLAGFTEDERKVLSAVRDQDGIKQSTLRFRTGLSKSMLSLILKSLESRSYVSRKPSGKTNEVFMRKVF